MLHDLAYEFGILDVDEVAALPLPKLMDWLDFFATQRQAAQRARSGKPRMSPEVAAALLARRFGGG